MTIPLRQTLKKRSKKMDNVYYKGELIPAEKWDYTTSKPKENVSKKEPKKADVALPPEVALTQE